MPAWYCLIVRKGCEAGVAERVVQAVGTGEGDIVLSKVNRSYVLVRMAMTLQNIKSVAEITDTLFFIGSPDPPAVAEADVDLVREGREGTGEDSFLARRFNDWLWERMTEEADRDSRLSSVLRRNKGQVEFVPAQALIFLAFGAAALASIALDVSHRCAHVFHRSAWFSVASVQWSLFWMAVLAAAVGFSFTRTPKWLKIAIGWLVSVAAYFAWLAQLFSWQHLYLWGCDR